MNKYGKAEHQEILNNIIANASVELKKPVCVGSLYKRGSEGNYKMWLLPVSNKNYTKIYLAWGWNLGASGASDYTMHHNLLDHDFYINRLEDEITSFIEHASN